jgi:hypothetical protein
MSQNHNGRRDDFGAIIFPSDYMKIFGPQNF